ARFDSSREECTNCLEGTRTGILEDIHTWATNRHSSVFWLNGQPGSGKTTIARTVASRCHAEGILSASFFCSRDRVSEILKKDPLLAHSAVTRQFEELIIQPLAHLRDLHNDGSPIPPCVVVIDALDECRDPKATSAILSSLLKHADKLSPLRFFVTSRPERHIVATFNFPGYRNAFGQLPLHEVELEVVTPDINHYITVSFSKIAESLRVPKSWPNRLHVEELGLRSNGLFIFAATAVKYVGDTVYGDPVGRLERLMSATAEAGPHQLLDGLYLEVLKTAFPSMPDDLPTRVKSILGSIVVAQDSLPVSGLSRLVGLSVDTVYNTLSGLHSVLIVPESETSTSAIRIIHPTFAEFLINSSRCTNQSFAVNSQQQHTELLRGSLKALQELRRDICNIRDPSLLNTEVPNLLDRREEAIPAHVMYACRHWCTHLVNGGLSSVEIFEPLVELVENRLLYWVEACSVLGVLREAILGLSESRRKLRVSAIYSLQCLLCLRF
ncbi:uncharacterized protein PHACADRAFT_85072, partial [Phanerochaete carnosa HHB-10118-sp]